MIPAKRPCVFLGRIGAVGENTAIEFLKRKGFQILDRNFRTPYGEIDIVALSPSRMMTRETTQKTEITFVEVKMRTSSTFGTPEESMTCRKISRLEKAIKIYLQKKYWIKNWRIDFIGITLDKKGRILHIEHTIDIEGRM